MALNGLFLPFYYVYILIVVIEICNQHLPSFLECCHAKKSWKMGKIKIWFNERAVAAVINMAEQFLRLVNQTAKFQPQHRALLQNKFRSNKNNQTAPAKNNANSRTSIDFFGYNKQLSLDDKDAAQDQHEEQYSSEASLSEEEEQKEETILADKFDESSSDAAPTLFKNSSIKKARNNNLSTAADAPAKGKVDRFHAMKEFKKEYSIHTSGSDVPAPVQSFEELIKIYKVPEYIINNLTAAIPEGCGYTEPTAIQMQAIPILLKNRELMACAQTGSGKTAAFVIPILTALQQPAAEGYRAIVLSPTRELAQQIYREFLRVSAGRNWHIQVLTKLNANNEATNIKKRDILITTPARLAQLVKEKDMDLSAVEYLIMDEADRLFDLGFLEQVDAVMAVLTNKSIKRALFSATMSQGVESLARTILHDPIRITVGHRNSAVSNIEQSLHYVGTEPGKLLALRSLIQHGLSLPMLIFVQSKERAVELYSELIYDNIHVDAIHSDKSQVERDEIMRNFRSGAVWVLICTDLLARGIDFKGVNCVLNYDFPQSTASYIHRIGRTGRAGRKGTAITYFTQGDKPLLRSIATIIKHSGGQVAEWMLALDKIGSHHAKQLAQHAPPRQPINENVANLHKQQKEKKRNQIKNKLAKAAAKQIPGKDQIKSEDKRKLIESNSSSGSRIVAKKHKSK
jgi:ATP-dependent RNA helicase DDX52/ROK1